MKNTKTNITDVGTSSFQRYLYRTKTGGLLLKLLVRPSVSRLGAKYVCSRFSVRHIDKFARNAGIDLSIYEDKKYTSFNDFFTRKIRPEARPVDFSADALVSPCDANLTHCPIDADSRFAIKGSYYSVEDLLGGDKDLAATFVGGDCLIFRLEVQHYHRYFYFDNGMKGENVFVPGVLHTVHPLALEKYNFFKQNSREYTVLETENFGKVAQIEIGALMVGKISNLHGSHTFTRGEEKGMFEFGGSTIVLLFAADKVQLQQEILDTNNAGKEHPVLFGQPIGRRKV